MSTPIVPLTRKQKARTETAELVATFERNGGTVSRDRSSRFNAGARSAEWSGSPRPSACRLIVRLVASTARGSLSTGEAK